MINDAQTGSDHRNEDPLHPALHLQCQTQLIERQMAEIDFKGPGTQKVPGAVYLPSQGIFSCHSMSLVKPKAVAGVEKKNRIQYMP